MTARTTRALAHGLTTFAGAVLLIGSGFEILNGLALIFGDKAVYVAGSDYGHPFDAATWGWMQLTLGVISFIAGISLATGALGLLVDDRDRLRTPSPNGHPASGSG